MPMMLRELANQRFQDDLVQFKVMGGNVDVVKPMLDDFEDHYITDGQYIFMNRWAFEHIIKEKPAVHIDIGGQVAFASLLSVLVPVYHIDIREPGIKIGSMKYVSGSITQLPYNDNSVESLSCLHVAEHIGLGRYGDEIDPDGFKKACRELSRVLAPNGILYFAVPSGKSKTVFNAHRIFASFEVLEQFHDLKLLDFAGMNSRGLYVGNSNPNVLDDDIYGCGMYRFTKEI